MTRTRTKDEDLAIRKSVTMPAHMWDSVSEFQKAESIATEVEALRRLVIGWHPFSGGKIVSSGARTGELVYLDFGGYIRFWKVEINNCAA